MPLRHADLRPAAGSTHARKRIGRGNASGHGTYATKGLKGQKARAGGGVRPGFEGGQMPLVRRMPHKRGFRPPFPTPDTAINVVTLARRFEAGAEVTAASLAAVGLLRSAAEPFKILGGGDVSHPLRLRVPRISAAARAKIEAAGGSVEEANATRADGA